jgi:hypothetical protein
MTLYDVLTISHGDRQNPVIGIRRPIWPAEWVLLPEWTDFQLYARYIHDGPLHLALLDLTDLMAGDWECIREDD